MIITWSLTPLCTVANDKELHLPSALIQQSDDDSILSSSLTDHSQLSQQIKQLAIKLLNDQSISKDMKTTLRLQTSAGLYLQAWTSLQLIRKETKGDETQSSAFIDFHYELFIKARLQQSDQNISFESALAQVFGSIFSKLSNQQAYHAGYYSTYSLEQGESYLKRILVQTQQSTDFTTDTAIKLVRQYQEFIVYQSLIPTTQPMLQKDIDRRYVINTDVLIKTPEGITLSALVVRDRTTSRPAPSALLYTIYSDPPSNLREALHAAVHGYIGVVADARGKRLSPDRIAPYETEAIDVNAVIDWISKQPWSDGRVAMYGGSYSGFAQWAATKNIHPALKTIVPYVAAIPGLGLPMENNIFLNANYGWVFYVSNNKSLDFQAYNDRQRWDQLNQLWYQSGKAYRKIDKIDGTPNPWLQRWLTHPGYDKYWQNMVPYKNDYAQINIPVLSITGYYDDGQISALHYLNQHKHYNPQANHYLIIGPYDHRSAQGRQQASLRGYQLDSVAFIDIPEITFQWLDYVLKSGDKPTLIKDRINHQLMGSNQWRHEPSLAGMNAKKQRYYLSRKRTGDYHSLTTTPEQQTGFLSQEVDFKDRQTEHNDYYPWPIIKDYLDIPNGLSFISPAMKHDVAISGQFSGQLKVRLNKKDLDLGIVLYEILPDGRAFHLSYYLGRASYAKDMTTRQLLTPGTIETLSFERTRMTSKLVRKGSRLLALLNVNKNPYAQINYGSGKDVSDETIVDATENLQIDWFNNSYLEIPMKQIN